MEGWVSHQEEVLTTVEYGFGYGVLKVLPKKGIICLISVEKPKWVLWEGVN